MLVLAAFAVNVACQATPQLSSPAQPADVRAACALAEQRCTACHERDRLIYADKTPDEWRVTVDRMRRMAGSSIAPSETETILQCLVYRSKP